MAGNVPLIIMMVLAVVLLFISMILSAMASSAASSGCTNDPDGKAHRYSMYAAIVCGVASALIAVALLIYIFSKPIGEYAGGKMQNLQQRVDAFRGAVPPAVSSGPVGGYDADVSI